MTGALTTDRSLEILVTMKVNCIAKTTSPTSGSHLEEILSHLALERDLGSFLLSEIPDFCVKDSSVL